MISRKKELQQLFDKAVWSAADRKWLFEYLEENNSEDLKQLMQQLFASDIDSFEKPREEIARTILEKIHGRLNVGAKPLRMISMKFWFKHRVAAAILFLLIGTSAIYYLMDKNQNKADFSASDISQALNILPGGNKAVLMLADGGKVILDTVSNGVVAHQTGAKVYKSGNGQIEYKSEENRSEKIDYNVVSTPVGGQYQLTLSDGSKVWLNSVSSIRFPVNFKGPERKVSVSGEVYFEINHLSSKLHGNRQDIKDIPFLVEVENKGTIRVLGTHFNVNTYQGEYAMTTTLLEGSIQFTPFLHSDLNNTVTASSVLLNVGQQVSVANNGDVKLSNDVNLEKVVAWKNGYFLFSSSSIQEVMGQLARWYDIEIVYTGKIKDRKFGGKIQMGLNLAETLKILERNNIKFRMVGKKLYVASL